VDLYQLRDTTSREIVKYYIDANRKGNETREINSSRRHRDSNNQPVKSNAQMLKCVKNNTPSICIFATRDIMKGEEVLLDYDTDPVISRKSSTFISNTS